MNLSFVEEEIGVKHDPNLDDYVKNNPNPFPKKLALATELVEKYYLPNLNNNQKVAAKKIKKQKKNLSILQQELLIIYDLQPNDQKLATLKAFMQELFAEEIAAQKAKISEYTEGGVLS
jgi:uncharacterized protein YjaZ